MHDFAQCRHCQSGVESADRMNVLKLSSISISISSSMRSLLFTLQLFHIHAVNTQQRAILPQSMNHLFCSLDITYFSGFFVFDGDLALVLAVADVSQLVIKQIRCCHRHRHEQQRKERGNAAHCASEPCHRPALFSQSALASSLIHYTIRISSTQTASGTRYGVTHSISTHAHTRPPRCFISAKQITYYCSIK